jgi:hypothetical protein
MGADCMEEGSVVPPPPPPAGAAGPPAARRCPRQTARPGAYYCLLHMPVLAQLNSFTHIKDQLVLLGRVGGEGNLANVADEQSSPSLG